MLEKVHTLSNIGLFQHGVPSAIDLGKATLIYAENGRGKSTFSTVLRAAGEGDATRIRVKQTLDSSGEPRVGLIVGGSSVKFERSAWSGPRPRFFVFDGEFVERNVYSGVEVRAEQRQALLDFALGDAAVALKQDVERIAAESVEATKQRTGIEGKIAGYRSGLSLQEFRNLAADADADSKIEKLKGEIAISRQQEGILRRPDPSTLPLFTPDLSAVFEVLETSIKDIEAKAEQRVKAHLATQEARGFEIWISQGQRFLVDGACPFCGQSIQGLELVDSYRTYFNEGYVALKDKVSGLVAAIDRQVPVTVSAGLLTTVQANKERISAWDLELNPTSHPVLINTVIASSQHRIRERLLALSNVKRESPLEAVDTSVVRAETQREIDAVNDLIRSYNKAITAIGGSTSAFKSALASTDVKQLEGQVATLQLQKLRHSPQVAKDLNELDRLEALKGKLEQEKAAARLKLDVLMDSTLKTFGAEINAWLTQFGASFSIEEMKPDYQGGGLPRTKYGLRIRDRVISLAPKDPLRPSFATTLSDGDKRTLAFAFFLSSLFGRPDRSELIVVVDDPVTSLDLNRRSRTREALVRVAKECKQLVVLAHDARFLFELEKRLHKKVKLSAKVFEVKRTVNDYSVIDECDLEELCSSDYSRHYSLILDYVEATSTVDPHQAAKALRLLIEGHLHRRFPRSLKAGTTLGVVIDAIRNATPPSPLVALQPNAAELDTLNDYASRFHHDTNPSADTEPVVQAELLGYCKQALTLIHTGTP